MVRRNKSSCPDIRTGIGRGDLVLEIAVLIVIRNIDAACSCSANLQTFRKSLGLCKTEIATMVIHTALHNELRTRRCSPGLAIGLIIDTRKLVLEGSGLTRVNTGKDSSPNIRIR